MLHIKASEGDLTGVTEMKNNGSNPMDKDECGNVALHYAARNGHLNIIEYFC